MPTKTFMFKTYMFNTGVRVYAQARPVAVMPGWAFKESGTGIATKAVEIEYYQ